MKESERLALLLIRHLAAGRIPAGDVLPVLSGLLATEHEPLSFSDLVDELRRSDIPAVAGLCQQLLRRQIESARQAHRQARQEAIRSFDKWPELAGLPVPPSDWEEQDRLVSSGRLLLRNCRFLDFLKGQRGNLPKIRALIEERRDSAKHTFEQLWNRWSALLPGPADWSEEMADVAKELNLRRRGEIDKLLDGTRPPGKVDIDEDMLAEELLRRFREAGVDVKKKRTILDLALVWPSDRIASALPELCQEPWSQDRAAAVLTVRFGKTGFQTWADWASWLAKQAEKRQQRVASLASLAKEFRHQVLLLWYSEQERPDPGLLAKLEARAAAGAASVDPREIVSVWQDKIPPEEMGPLLGLEPEPETAGAKETAGPKAPTERAPAEAVAAPASGVAPLAASVETKPTEESEARQGARIWRDNIRPFLIENWYMVVGLAMVLVGASLLAYFTWDKHWVLRYTIMPSLLAAFALSIAAIGSWLERKFPVLKSTSVMLRGAAIGLLPLNFMALALLSMDQAVTHKVLGLAVMGAVYLAGFGWALRRWCGSVHPALANLQGGVLLALNALVGLVPICILAMGKDEAMVRLTLGVGLYAGFALSAFATGWFVRRSLTREMLRERRVPWFLGVCLAATFLEVFAFIHLALGELPKATTYSVMVVLAGGLVIFMERYFYRLRGAGPGYGGESFLGYAFVLAGVLMGMSSPYVRIAVLTLAGVVWLFQASLRSGTLQYWIGLTFLLLGCASVGLLDAFPKSTDINAIPAIGFVAAVGLRILQACALRYNRDRLAGTARNFLPGVLVLTAVVSVLSQWHYRSDPWMTGGILIIIAGLIAWRAERDTSWTWAYTTMSLLALSLPFLGCADMRGHAMYGNNMTFGLGLLGGLWLAFLRLRPRQPWLQARSTVLLVYGVLALAAMLLRVVIEQGRFGATGGFRDALDGLGPMLITVVLIFACYHSRSLVPAILGALIGAVVFPELKTTIQRALPMVRFGSGLGSSIWGLCLVLISFPVSRWSMLKDLGPGDLLFGKTPFPLQRRDHTLFTWPLIGTALFLTAKVDTVNLVRNLVGDGVGVRTAVALGITSVSWVLLASAIRRRAFGILAVNLSWVTCLMCFGYLNKHIFDDPQMQMPLLFTGLALQVLYFISAALLTRCPWIDEVLLRPTRGVLRVASWLLAGAVAIALVVGKPVDEFAWLGAFLAAQLVWHSLSTKSLRYGSALFVLVLIGLVALSSPGTGLLLRRLSVEFTLTPALLLALAVMLIHLVLEWWPEDYDRLQPLLKPFHVGSALLIILGPGVVTWDVLLAGSASLSVGEQVLALVLVGLLARTHSSGELAVLFGLLAYLIVNGASLAKLGTPAARGLFLITPWRLALSGLVSVVLAEAGHWLKVALPRALEGRFSLGAKGRSGRSCIFPIATIVVSFATVYYLVDPDLRGAEVQLWAPYLATAALLVIAVSWWHAAFAVLGTVTLCVGNIQAVDIYAGQALLARGLSKEHVTCLGLVATLVQAALVRWRLRRDDVRRFIRKETLVIAAAVLALLTMHYFTHPNLATVSLWRFAVSGLMAYAAGLYFRWAARHDGEANPHLLEAVYHFGLAVAIWCFALMIPWLRNPNTALLAIGIPPLYFYVRAEYGWRQEAEAARETALRYRTSSTILCFGLLAMYAAKAACHMVLFPDAPFSTNHYHHNAPVVIVVGLVLLRLHGLGVTRWAAYYGGLALSVGMYFGITAWPGLSPFSFPVPAAWAAVMLSHFFLVAWSRRSPVRTALQEIGRFDGDTWEELRRAWGHSLLWASTVAVLFGLADYARDPRAIAPLMVGAASLFLHKGILGRVKSYLIAAGVILALALHADFVLTSYLDRQHIVWVILALWAALVAGDPLWRRWLPRQTLTAMAALFLAGSFGHVLYHDPWSVVGLAAMALAGALWLLTPLDERRPLGVAGEFTVALPLLWAPWLVYFSQVHQVGGGVNGMIESWPVLTGTAAILVTGALGRACRIHWASAIEHLEVRRTRIAHQMLGWLAERGAGLNRVLLWVVLLLSAALLCTHYGRAFSSRETVVFAALWIGSAVAWFLDGRDRSSLVANTIGQLCVAGLVVMLRRQLMLRVDWWTLEYDVWFALAASAGFAGAKPWIDTQDKHLRLSLLGSQLVLPVLAISWTLIHGLGTDVTLVVLSLNGVLFAYLGRGERESKYNIVAVSGFVAFVAVLFWQKLELRFVHAYVIPTGVGLLVLLQLFGDQMRKEARNGIRLVILLAMLGSAGYYALLDDRFPVGFNLTMLLLGLAAMCAGSFLRVRLYVLLGGLGILTDLASLGYKAIIRMERTYQMTAIGALLLLLGVAVVAGAVYYKTQRDAIEKRLNKLRERLGVWE